MAARPSRTLAKATESVRLSLRAFRAPFTSSSKLASPSVARRSPQNHTNLTSRRQYASMSTSRAIVASEPKAQHHGGDNWSMEDVKVPSELKDGEVLVQMVATGICHTDLALTSPDKGQTFPIVPGHEGSGYVRAVGPNVTKQLKPGDPVLLSFDSCTKCGSCEAKRPAYCDTFVPLNLFGESDVFRDGRDESKGVGGKFFGHSSFANLSIVKDTTILPAKDLIQSEDELKLFSPLGCGIQTGAGSILNLTKPGPEDVVLVTGLGGVGLSAVMGAHIAGCKRIVAVDRIQSRIDIAKTFGATHGLNTTDLTDLTGAMREVSGGRGPSVVIETTGFPPVIESAFHAVDTKGSFVQVGGPADPNYRMSTDLVNLLFRGVKLFGCVEGDSVPADFIPELIKHYRAGKLPVDKMVKYYPAEEFKTALHDMHSGKTIKPVLVW